MDPQKYRVVPWRNPEQFRNVYKCLYSQSITDKRWAVDQISVWESRCYPSLPTAIDATVGLVRAVIQDLLCEVEKSFCQAKDIQMYYAMALVRFINLTLEIEQSVTNRIQLSVLAEKNNIPTWIINLRHEAVHGTCPSLPVLRMGVQTALTYLEDSFWKVEVDNIQSVMLPPSDDNEELLDLINRYRNIQHCRREKKGDSQELLSDRKAILKNLGRHIEGSKGENVIDTLLLPRVFICIEDVVRILQASASVYFELEEDVSLPPELETFWFPMVKVLHQYDLIHRFLEKLVRSQENCSVRICQKIAAAWAMRIFHATSSHTSNRALDRIFRNKGVLFYLERLLYACLKGFNKDLIPFFNMVAHRLGYREECRDLFCIAAMKQGLFVPECISNRPMLARTSINQPSDTTMSEIVFTLEDVEDDLNELRMRRKRQRKEDNIWSLAPASFDMSNIPLGAVLNPINSEEIPVNEEPQPETPAENPPEERFIFCNENDNEEITVEEKDTPDNWLETFRPEEYDMVYRRKQKN